MRTREKTRRGRKARANPVLIREARSPVNRAARPPPRKRLPQARRRVIAASAFSSTEKRRGQVAEWLKAPHSKCGIGATLSGVRIPPCPPFLQAFGARLNTVDPTATFAACPSFIGLGVVLLLALVFGPQFWVQWAMKRHGGERPDLRGRAGNSRGICSTRRGLQSVPVEETEIGDHYDPEARAVRLLPQNLAGRSVTAVAIAAHEVSHAIQHAREEPGFVRRTQVIGRVIWIDRLATIVLLSTPLLAVLVKAPALIALQIGLGVLLLLVRVAVHLVTLPVEFDASFRKALPILEQGRYLDGPDVPAAREVTEGGGLDLCGGRAGDVARRGALVQDHTVLIRRP